jgi:pimeloyl-ACP methyl ester carboxylesterase
MELVRGTDIVDRLGRVRSPTLVSVGGLDPVTPVGAAEEIVAGLPGGLAQLDVVDGAGHFTWLDDPDRYWPTIVEFVCSTAAREAASRTA